MKALVTVPSIYNESAGTSYVVPLLCGALSKHGVNVQLHVLDKVPKQNRDYIVNNYVRRRFPISALGRCPEMLKALRKELKECDIVHNNGVWMMPNVYPYWAARGKGVKVVTSPHGTLSKWALNHSKYKKKLFGMLIQYPALRRTDMWHATCEKEYEEIRIAGYKQPVAIIPIGIDLPDVSRRINGDNTRHKVVFFGRIHKVKGIDNLVMAWERIAGRFLGWELVIAGPDGGFKGDLQGLIDNGKIPRTSFTGEINGTDKYAFLASADLFALPSHTENFAVTVAESLACGTPVVVSKGTPWSGVAANGCGMWVDADVETLAAALEEMMSLDDVKRNEMGLCGREWMRRDFGWESIGMKMKIAYEWLLNGGEPPEWVRIE